MSERPQTTASDPLRPLRREETLAPEDLLIGKLLMRVRPLEPLTELTLARIRRRLDQEARPKFRVWVRAIVAAAASLFIVEIAVAATISVLPATRRQIVEMLVARLAVNPSKAATIPSEPDRVETIKTLPSLRQTASPVPEIPAAPSLEPNAADGQPAQHNRLPSRTTRTSSEGAADSAMFSQALHQLNVEHDAEAALATLRSYRERYPHGLFWVEAATAEIRADLIAGHNRAALAILDDLQKGSFTGVPQAAELRLLRAELLSSAERCEEALPVFAEYDRPSFPPASRERALYAKAICRARLADPDGSREDLTEYLREFPEGRFASAVRQALSNQR